MASHIPRKLNLTADLLYRNFALETEWMFTLFSIIMKMAKHRKIFKVCLAIF